MNKKAAEAVAKYFADLERGGGDQAIDREITDAIEGAQGDLTDSIENETP
jgi:hypothetical protein